MKRTTSTRNVPEQAQAESEIKFGTQTQPPNLRLDRCEASPASPPTVTPVPIVLPPKRKCSEAQLRALAAGRAKNPKFRPKDRSEPPF